MSESVLEGAKKWLEKHGFPFELLCTKEMKKAGFLVSPHGYFLDETDGVQTPREIDLRAWRAGKLEFHNSECILELEATIECKVSKVPWIGFVDLTSNVDDLCRYATRQVYPSEQIRTAIRALVKTDEVLPIARGLAEVHSNIVAMAEGGRDFAFEAMAKVLKVAFAAARESGARVANRRSLIVVAFPCILVDGPLVSCRLSDVGGLELREVERLMLATHGFAPGSEGPTHIPVVTRTSLPAFASEMAETFSILLERATANPYLFATPP